jgi:hypothetical protein
MQVCILKERMHIHKFCQFNYTTYDLRRAQDIVNTTTHADVMTLAHEEDHKQTHHFWYARVCSIFHVNVKYKTHPTQSMAVLWVRWLGLDPDHSSGWSARRLHRVGFVPDGSTSPAFGFLDPAAVIRAVHLQPAFHYGRTRDLLGPSISRPEAEGDEDWRFFYVGMCVNQMIYGKQNLLLGLHRFSDRDLVMRYRGTGIGHAEMRYDPMVYEGRDVQPSEDILEDVAHRRLGPVPQSEDGSESDATSISYGEDIDNYDAPLEDIEDMLAGGSLGADEGEDVGEDNEDPGLYGYAAE